MIEGGSTSGFAAGFEAGDGWAANAGISERGASARCVGGASLPWSGSGAGRGVETFAASTGAVAALRDVSLVAGVLAGRAASSNGAARAPSAVANSCFCNDIAGAIATAEIGAIGTTGRRCVAASVAGRASEIGGISIDTVMPGSLGGIFGVKPRLSSSVIRTRWSRSDDPPATMLSRRIGEPDRALHIRRPALR